MQQAVFLDRDNTLIPNDGDLGDPQLVRLMPGAAQAIASLSRLGYRIIVVSNQGGVARGKYDEGDVERVHARINELVQAESGATIDRFYFCPYHPQGTVPRYRREHPWRKPQPGMILQAAGDLDLDLAGSWTLGDQIRDIEAGRAAGTRTILVTDAPLGGSPAARPDFVVRDLLEAAQVIARLTRPQQSGSI
jgi:histidinol-phosphate phosphatase family protein